MSMNYQRRLNELELDDEWQRGVFNRLLRRVLQRATCEGGIVFVDHDSDIAKVIQHQAHADIVVQIGSGTLSIEVKLVRWPRYPGGAPSYYHWPYFFLEMWSCTVPGHRTRGWMGTSKANILLWGQVAADENAVDCFPLPFGPLRDWTRRHWRELQQRYVRNTIDGRSLWTLGRLAPINKVCRDLKVEGFRVDEQGLVSTLWGRPLLPFMREAAA